jgi:hypothetical protein
LFFLVRKTDLHLSAFKRVRKIPIRKALIFGGMYRMNMPTRNYMIHPIDPLEKFVDAHSPSAHFEQLPIASGIPQKKEEDDTAPAIRAIVQFAQDYFRLSAYCTDSHRVNSTNFHQ